MSVLAQTSAQFGEYVLKGFPPSNDGSNHADDKHYQGLRDRARKAQSQGAHFASEASKAYKSGSKAEASELSSKSKSLRAEADNLNEEAASWVFRANNTDSAADEIDLHGLFVKEALIALDARLSVCQQHNQPFLKAIVGKGLHSETHIAKLRPAVEKHCKEKGFQSEVDKHNPGVVIINTAGGTAGTVGSSYATPGGYSAPNQYQQTQYQQTPAQQQPAQGSTLVQIIVVLWRCFC